MGLATRCRIPQASIQLSRFSVGQRSASLCLIHNSQSGPLPALRLGAPHAFTFASTPRIPDGFTIITTISRMKA